MIGELYLNMKSIFLIFDIMLPREFSSQITFKSRSAFQNQCHPNTFNLKMHSAPFCSPFHPSDILHTALDNVSAKFTVFSPSGF